MTKEKKGQKFSAWKRKFFPEKQKSWSAKIFGPP